MSVVPTVQNVGKVYTMIKDATCIALAWVMVLLQPKVFTYGFNDNAIAASLWWAVFFSLCVPATVRSVKRAFWRNA